VLTRDTEVDLTTMMADKNGRREIVIGVSPHCQKNRLHALRAEVETIFANSTYDNFIVYSIKTESEKTSPLGIYYKRRKRAFLREELSNNVQELNHALHKLNKDGYQFGTNSGKRLRVEFIEIITDS